MTPDMQQQHCFQIITPTRIYFLAATRRSEVCDWIFQIRKEMCDKMDHQSDHQAQQKAAAAAAARSDTPLDKVLKAPANQTCADCGAKYAECNAKKSLCMMANTYRMSVGIQSGRTLLTESLCVRPKKKKKKFATKFVRVMRFFLGTECSGIHRRLSPTPIVKSTGFGKWDPAHIEVRQKKKKKNTTRDDSFLFL